MPENPPRKLTSQLLADDPEMHDLVREFVGGLPAQLGALADAIRQSNWEQLRLLAHRLKGACGSYGYPDLSSGAAHIEAAFAQADADAMQRALDELKSLAAAAEAGLA
ncbi:MAG: hypothetical protein CHACPFDD_01273 [Phycisphaerae bacterium]|nr:hypothetical protein [Phycisphaerae bacterium]